MLLVTFLPTILKEFLCFSIIYNISVKVYDNFLLLLLLLIACEYLQYIIIHRLQIYKILESGTEAGSCIPSASHVTDKPLSLLVREINVMSCQKDKCHVIWFKG